MMKSKILPKRQHGRTRTQPASPNVAVGTRRTASTTGDLYDVKAEVTVRNGVPLPPPAKFHLFRATALGMDFFLYLIVRTQRTTVDCIPNPI